MRQWKFLVLKYKHKWIGVTIGVVFQRAQPNIDSSNETAFDHHGRLARSCLPWKPARDYTRSTVQKMPIGTYARPAIRITPL